MKISIQLNGLYGTSANDSKDLSNVVMKLYDNPTEILEMGANARKCAKEALTWDKFADIFLDSLNFCK